MENHRELIISGRISQIVAKLTWPNIIINIFNIAAFLTDRFFLGRLGEDALAVVTSVWAFSWVFEGTLSGIFTALVALLTRLVGEGKTKEAEAVSRQAVSQGLLLCLGLTCISLLFAEPILSFLGVSAPLLRQAKLYYYLVVSSYFLWFLMFGLISILRGLGDMKTPVKVFLIFNLINIVLDYGLIFGIGFFPELGVLGAGIALAVARLIAVLILLFILLGYPGFKFFSGSFKPELSWFHRLFGLGFPITLQNILRNVGMLIYISLLGRIPQAQAAIATVGVGMGIEGLAYVPGVAYGVAASAMVGQNLGAGEPERARKSSWLAACQATFYISLGALLFSLFAFPIAGAYAQNPQTIRLLVYYLWINAFSEPFIALAIVLGSALEGAGDTRASALISIATMWLVRLPLAYLGLEVFKLGAVAAWFAMSFSSIVNGIWITLRFKSGKWQKTRV